MWGTFVSAVGFGVVLASIIAVAAMGFTIQFGLTNVLNLSFGAVMTVAAFAAYLANRHGVGGWAGIGLAAGLLQPENAAAWHGAVDQGKLPPKDKTVDTAGLGAVGGYAGLASYTSLGGTLTVFALPSQ